MNNLKSEYRAPLCDAVRNILESLLCESAAATTEQYEISEYEW